MSSSLSDALIVLVLGAVSVLYEWKLRDKRLRALEEDLSKKLEKIELTLTDKTKDIGELRTYISGLKLGILKNPSLGVRS